jgi:hypothetical protein
LDDPTARGGGIFGRKRLGSRDAELVPVPPEVKTVLVQVTRRELFKGLAAD